MIQAIALDDEPLALQVLEDFCSKTDLIKLEKSFTKPNDALKYLSQFPTDLLFLDIKMPSINGIDFHKMLPHNYLVIFTTAHSEFAVEGFNLDAVDYLLKPFSFDRFIKAITRANEYYQSLKQSPASKQYFFVRADYSLIKINFADILYIEGLDDYVKIHMENQRAIVPRLNIKSILEKLPANEFIRVHRSFIVPLSRVKNIRNKHVLINDMPIPISSKYEEDFLKMIKS